MNPQEQQKKPSYNYSPVTNDIPRHTQPKFVSSIGKSTVALLIFLFVVCLGCLAFVAFLWGSDTNNSVWRSIVVSERLTISITIASLVLRWATAMQAAICTSMLAAILLQKGGVPLHLAAAVSIIRCHNTGPWLLLDTIGTKWHRGSFLAGFLVTMLTLTTISLQFTSTVLLSQVGLASLPVTLSNPKTYYGTNYNGPGFQSMIGGSASFLQTTPVRYPAFAEWIANETHTQHGEFAPSSTPGLRDTGTVIRAFLPLEEDLDRRRLTEYHGFATAVDTRVICTRPNLTNVFFSSGDGYRVSGLADVKKEPLGLLRRADSEGSRNYSMSFDCGFAAEINATSSSSRAWPIALCGLSQLNSKQGIVSAMQPEGGDELGARYLLINATETTVATDFDDSDIWETLTLEDSYSESPSSNAMTIQFTLCFAASEAREIRIDATRPEGFVPEPTMLWDTLTASYDITDVQQQLGAGTPRFSPKDRGIFSLAHQSWKWPDPPRFLSLTGGSFSTTWALDDIGLNDMYDGTINGAQYSLLAYIATYTSDPSLALQAYLTTLCALCYYDRIIMFDVAAPSSRVSLVQVTRPLSWTAFIIVTGVAALHLLLILTVISIYHHSGTLSRIGNAWASISQILGPTTDSWIRDVDIVDDKTVKSWLEQHGLQETLVEITSTQSRVQLVEKYKIS